MSDNTTITPGSGATVAADNIGGALHQRVKVTLGADGSATDALGGAGAVAAGVQRTTLASDDPAVTSLAVMDDWDESDRAKVNPIAGQAGVAGGSGTVSALTQRVVLATDVALPAGTNAIGKLAANSGVDIGDVDVTTVVPGTGATSLGKAEDAAHASGDTGVAVLARRADVPASSAGTDGDYATVNQDASGRAWVRPHCATGTVTSQTDQATNVTLLAANAARVGATIYNDSTAILYLKFGATASATSFTAKLQPESYFEVPYGYTGIIDGIWASDASGSARITELT